MTITLYGAEIDITEGRRTFTRLRNELIGTGDMAAEDFLGAFANLSGAHDAAAQGYEIGADIILRYARLGVDSLIKDGFYDVTLEHFYANYLSRYCSWDDAFAQWEAAYNEIIEAGEDMARYRQQRRDNRSRLVGGGFSILGAAKGIALAGAANMASGIAHGLVNTVGNARTRSSLANQLHALFLDNQQFLANAVRNTVGCLYIAMFDFVRDRKGLDRPVFLDAELSDRADRIKGNLIAGKIPSANVAEVVRDILEANPYDLNGYRLALTYAGDPLLELEQYGNNHDVDVLGLKRKLVATMVDPYLSKSDYRPVEAIETLDRLADQFACASDEVIRHIKTSIDHVARSFEDELYASIAEREQAAADKSRLDEALKTVGRDFAAAKAKAEALHAATYTYRGAARLLAEFDAKVSDLEKKTRSFDGTVYATVETANQARSDKKTISAAYVVGAEIGRDLDKARADLARLRALPFVYAKAPELLAAFESAIEEEDTKRRTVDGHLYETQEKAAQARAEKKTLGAACEQVDRDLDKAREELARLQAQPFVYVQAADKLAAFADAIERKDIEQRTVDGQVYESLELAGKAAAQRTVARRLGAAEAATQASGDASPSVPERRMGVLMVLAIFFFPYVAPLFVLRRGYSIGARIFAFLVPALYLAVWMGYLPLDPGSAPVPASIHATPAATAALEAVEPPVPQQAALPDAAAAQPRAEPADTASAPATAAPFEGKREFNFMGGNGTQYAIVIGPDQQTRIEFIGTTGSLLEYEGPFRNPVPLKDGTSLLFTGGRVQLMRGDVVETGCQGEGQACISELY